MAFGLFKKKGEIVDLRKWKSDVPLEGYLKRKGEIKIAGGVGSSIGSASSEVSGNQASASSNSGGGFFGGFFGGSDSSSNSSNLSSVSDNANSATSTAPQTDFWGNLINTGKSESSINSLSSYNSSSNDSGSQINDIIRRFSGVIDRLELVEKKLDRLERRGGSL